MGEDVPFPLDRGFVLLMLLQCLHSPGICIVVILIYNTSITDLPPGVLC